jgi:hypothetical protein
MLSNVSCSSYMPYIWNTQTFINSYWIVHAIKLSLKDQFKQSWHISIQNSPKTLIYKCFKRTLAFEIYLEILDNKYLFEFLKFRTTNHKRHIESESESVNRRRTDNTMAKTNRTTGQITIYKSYI